MQPGLGLGLPPPPATEPPGPCSSTEPPNTTLLPCSGGLPRCCAAIPLIVHPIDTAVHALLNHSLRPLLRRHICNATGGAEAGLAICKDCQL